VFGIALLAASLAPFAIHAAPSSAEQPPPPRSDEAAPSPAEQPPPPRSDEARSFAPYDLLTFHKDNYFITGFTGATEAKLQFSAKYDLWPNDSQHAVHFAFTAKALWDIYKVSAPFVETNYDPEVFYTFFHHETRYQRAPGCGFFYERLGAEHESTGEAGLRSRGWNRVYVQSRFACYGGNGPFATVSLKVWAPPFGTSDNPEIVHYLGYGELGLSFGWEGTRFGDADLTILARKGTSRAIAEGSVEIGGRWRPAYAAFWRFTPYLYAQVFTGYGETLLAYDRPLTAFRVGIGLSDISSRSN
jgi:phospholipase A1